MSATKAETAPSCCGARKRQETILDSLSTVCIGTCAHFDFHVGCATCCATCKQEGIAIGAYFVYSSIHVQGLLFRRWLRASGVYCAQVSNHRLKVRLACAEWKRVPGRFNAGAQSGSVEQGIARAKGNLVSAEYAE